VDEELADQLADRQAPPLRHAAALLADPDINGTGTGLGSFPLSLTDAVADP
jgi:hypothetical protein